MYKHPAELQFTALSASRFIPIRNIHLHSICTLPLAHTVQLSSSGTHLQGLASLLICPCQDRCCKGEVHPSGVGFFVFYSSAQLERDLTQRRAAGGAGYLCVSWGFTG